MDANLDGIIEKANKSRQLNIMSIHSNQPQDHVVPQPKAGAIYAPKHILVCAICLVLPLGKVL